MQLTPKIKAKIQKSLFIRPDLKAQIIAQWQTLAPVVRDGIIEMIMAVDEVQQEMIKTSAKHNPNFLKDFQSQAKKSKSKAMKRIEAKDQAEEKADGILSELSNS